MNRDIFPVIAVLWFVLWGLGGPRFVLTGLQAGEFKEKTFQAEGTRISVRVLGEVEVTNVKPYMRIRKGEETGDFRMDVVIKNTSSKALSYSVYGEGKAEDGLWYYGGSTDPIRVDPGKEETVSIRTRYRGKAVPKEIRVQVLEVQP